MALLDRAQTDADAGRPDAASATLERALRIEPRHHGASDGYWLRAWQLFGFYDVGEVGRFGTRSAGTPWHQSLASAGLGTRLPSGRLGHRAA